MNRFSEDIDLTVKVLSEESNTRNKKRLKESALGYKIDGLELIKEECIDNKGSVTGMYKYTSVYADSEMPLQRAGKIQVESTSFTVGEPTEKYYIEPLLYKLASDDEKKIVDGWLANVKKFLKDDAGLTEEQCRADYNDLYSSGYMDYSKSSEYAQKYYMLREEHNEM